MSASFPIVGGAGRLERPSPADRKPPSTPAASFAQSIEGAAGSDSEPPPEVRAEVQAAARCADQLHQLGRELRFEREAESGRIRVEVRDLDGNVLRQVPLGEVVDFAAGRVKG
jgi:hypothetical protein